MIESLKHLLKRFIQKHWFIQEWDFISGLLNHDSNDLFKSTDSFKNKTSNLMIGSLNQKMCIKNIGKKWYFQKQNKWLYDWIHWIIILSDSLKNTDLIRNKTLLMTYWIITPEICSKTLFNSGIKHHCSLRYAVKRQPMVDSVLALFGNISICKVKNRQSNWQFWQYSNLQLKVKSTHW